MDPADRQALLQVVERFVHATVRGQNPPGEADVAHFDETGALFVTLRVRQDLRGCIGTLDSKHRLGALALRMAASALEDPRFRHCPILAEELDDLTVDLMLLGPERRIEDPSEIEIGRHGIVVSVGTSSGVFLPQVAVEHGWDAIELLEHCCRTKLALPADTWKLPQAKVSVFAGVRVSRETDRA